MDQIIEYSASTSLVILIGLLVVSSYRVWVGPTPPDRLQAIDLATTLLVGIIIVLGIVMDAALLIDVGIALAAFSFVSTLAIARFISEGRVF
jgi:multisubunit Na+/H+ antiporter MnhF subunit